MTGLFGGLGHLPDNPSLGGFGVLLDDAFGLGNFKKRRAFFSFHYDDVMRVNNVRQAWITHKNGKSVINSYTDSSLWESKKLEGPDSLKALIRNGVSGTSVVCVLIGTETWQRRWVRYEIARAIVDEKGLLGVHLNMIRHHKTKLPELFYGSNPLEFMGVGKDTLSGQYYLFEKLWDWNPYAGRFEWGWYRYRDYTLPVTLPPYLSDPLPGYVMPLSSGVLTFCYVQNNGYQNIGNWISSAASAVGR
ncbi:MAG: TIR domain-containing protein [Labrenzia sp.]